MGSGRTKASTWDCPTAQDLLDFFNEKIASVCQSTGGCRVKSALKHSMVTFDEFEEYSVVTRWTVDQEVVGSNPTHGGNLISVVRSLSGFTQPIR